MVDPSKLSSSSVFDSFKNNDYKTGTLSISGSVSPSAIATFTGSTTIDRAESVTQIYFATSTNSIFHSTGRNYLYTADTKLEYDNGSTASMPGFAPYVVLFSLEYSGTTLSLKGSILNGNSDTLTLVSETISFEAYTFIAPFAD